jgi:hypothetical protein
MAGLLVTVAGIAFSLVPPEGVTSVWQFEAKLAGGCLLVVAAGRIAFARGKRARS